MSDERLRELERRWRETGAVEDEASYLAERVRVGSLSRAELELAGLCGHQAARRASSAAGGSFVDVRHLAERLRRLPRGLQVGAALTVTTAMLERHAADGRQHPPNRLADVSVRDGSMGRWPSTFRPRPPLP